MTPQPDDRSPEDRPGDAQPAGTPFDEDAAWATIVANYGARPEMGPEPSAGDPGDADRPGVDQSGADRSAEDRPGLFDRTYLDAQLARAERQQPELDTPATWDDEGHFVPPTPPPLPTLDPRRKAAWIGLFGSPALMLIGIVLGWTFPAWLGFLLVAAFVGGFGYLVATMPRGGHDDWSGDDGAVV